MIDGIVRGSHSQATTGNAIVTLAVKPTNSTAIPIQVAVAVDTGFDGYLTLPGVIIDAMGLRTVGIQTFVLADNNEVRFKCYLAEVQWANDTRVVRILRSDGRPLVGMNLLWGHLFSMDTRHNGRVTIQ